MEHLRSKKDGPMLRCLGQVVNLLLPCWQGQGDTEAAWLITQGMLYLKPQSLSRKGLGSLADGPLVCPACVNPLR